MELLEFAQSLLGLTQVSVESQVTVTFELIVMLIWLNQVDLFDLSDCHLAKCVSPDYIF